MVIESRPEGVHSPLCMALTKSILCTVLGFIRFKLEIRIAQ